MTYNTGNPIGSSDPRDLRDNAQNIDIMANSPSVTSQNDRLGTPRKTLHGMEVEHDAQIVAHEAEFQDRIAGMAFTRVGTFAAGFTLTDSREVLLYETDGHEYGWTGAFPKVVPPASTPAGTGGVGAGAWVDRSDVTLRSDLNVVVKVFESVADIAADASLIIGQKCRTLGYYAVGDGGGNDYIVVAAATGTDDGGSYIDLSGSGFQAKGLFGSVVNVKQFGAKGDGTTDDTQALSNWIVNIRNGRGFIPKGVYNHTGIDLLPQYSTRITGEVYDNDSIGGSVLKNINTIGANSINIHNTPFVQVFDSQILLENITISGNSLSGNGIDAVLTMIFMNNVWINGHGGHGAYLERCFSSSFKQVSFSNNTLCGFRANIALNAVNFDHCLFNGNALVSGNSGCQLTGGPGVDRNFGVTFVSCDFTGNGATLTGADVGIGIAIQHSSGVNLFGCYGELNYTNNIYADSTASNLTITGSWWQDSDIDLVGVNGLIFKNNEIYDSGVTSTVVSIDCGMPASRTASDTSPNIYGAGVVTSLVGGATNSVSNRYTSPPSGGSWSRSDFVLNSNAQNGGGIVGWYCTNPGTPGDWLPIGVIPQVFADHGDADATLTVGGSFPVNFWRTPLTADRNITLSASNAFSGSSFRITRSSSSSGAFLLNVGGLKSLSTGQWCDIDWDGSSWQLSAFGSL